MSVLETHLDCIMEKGVTTFSFLNLLFKMAKYQLGHVKALWLLSHINF